MSSVAEQIDAIRREWGRKLLILGHHYQRSSVIRHADDIGDSLELARKAASHADAERIVFCGVRFMAESADILTGTGQTVYMPATAAGCPMAEMADVQGMTRAWETLAGASNGWLPVVYVNSTAVVKALCGRWHGSACTSSNAAQVFEWVFAQGKRVLFLPDEHLGVNTAHDLGLGDEEVSAFDPQREGGGLSAEAIAAARVVVWKGFCHVHTAFKAEQVRQVRTTMPQAKIIVHPEAPREVVRLCDAHGSTSQIIRYVENAPHGSTIVVGTENNLVLRLAEQHAPRVTVKALAPSVCTTMAMTNEGNLLDLLQHWPAANVIRVPEPVARDARTALETMLSL
jgi:quinolinate synthase